MKKQPLLTAFAIACTMLACNLPTASQSSPSETPPLPPTETQPAVPPTETALPLPTDTPTVTPTPTPSVPMVTTKDKSVNCRFGPGQEYVPIGSGLAVGASTQIFGKSTDGWWLVQNPSGGDKCWVAGSVTFASGNLGGIQVTAAPLAFVTNVTIQADPKKIDVPGCTFPVTISYTGAITVNGPVKVKWHWELSQGVSSPDDEIDFTGFGSQTLEDNYHVGAEGDYWVRLVVTSPNNMVAEAKYKAVCP